MSAEYYYTNDTARSLQTTSEFSLGMKTNYVVSSKSTDKLLILDNLTTGSALPGKDVICYKYNGDLKVVNNNLNITKPDLITSGVLYQIEYQTAVKITRDDSTVVEKPICVSLQMRHALDEQITDEMLATAFERLLSALRKESDNSWRFPDFVRGAMLPAEN